MNDENNNKKTNWKKILLYSVGMGLLIMILINYVTARSTTPASTFLFRQSNASSIGISYSGHSAQNVTGVTNAPSQIVATGTTAGIGLYWAGETSSSNGTFITPNFSIPNNGYAEINGTWEVSIQSDCSAAVSAAPFMEFTLFKLNATGEYNLTATQGNNGKVNSTTTDICGTTDVISSNLSVQVPAQFNTGFTNLTGNDRVGVRIDMWIIATTTTRNVNLDYNDTDSRVVIPSRVYSVNLPTPITLQPANDTRFLDGININLNWTNVTFVNYLITPQSPMNYFLDVSTDSSFKVINYSANEKWFNFSGSKGYVGGFSVQSAYSSSIAGTLTTNGSDFWISDSNLDYVFHFNATGGNVTGTPGINGGFNAQAGSLLIIETGITTNGSDFWISDSNVDYVYHFNAFGTNITDGFSLRKAYSSSFNSGSLTTNGSDFWVLDRNLDYVFHFNATGGNVTGTPGINGGFDLKKAYSSSNIDGLGITTNGSDFWVTDTNLEYVYHFNAFGTNITDGFSLNLSQSSFTTVTIDTNDRPSIKSLDSSGTNNFWINDQAGADYVYHFKAGISEKGVCFNQCNVTATAATNGNSFGNDATVGTVAWSNPTNAQTSDNNYASAVLVLDDVTNYLNATNFTFSIPAGAAINGINVTVERKETVGTGATDTSVSIIKNGVISGDEKADAVTNWPTIDKYATYGNSTDLWGLNWTPADINDRRFGFVISAIAGGGATTVSVDHIRIQIYYTQTGNTTNHTITSNLSNGDYFWRVQAWDGFSTSDYSYGNFTVGAAAVAAPNSCTYTSGNWNINLWDNCTITTANNLQNNNLIINGGTGGKCSIETGGTITNVRQTFFSGCSSPTNICIFQDNVGGLEYS